MADKKISALTGATTPLAGTEVIPVVQSSTTKKVSVANLTAGRAVDVDSLTATTTLKATTRLGIAATPSGSWRSSVASAEWGALGMAWLQSNGDFNLGYNTIEDGSNTFVYKLGGIPVGRLAISDGLKFYNATSGTGGAAITFTQRIDVDSSGNATLNTGNLVVGTAAKGIDFSANTGAAGMTSELLDWYEEGTWTPTYEGTTGSAGAVAYSEQAGSYTRIGNRVILTGTIILTNNGDWTGDVRISGMPFNSSTTSGSESMGSVQMRNVTTTGAYVVAEFGRTANNKIAFINVNSAGASTNVACADVPDNGAFLFTIIYRVA